jgi:hypothetical protein
MVRAAKLAGVTAQAVRVAIEAGNLKAKPVRHLKGEGFEIKLTDLEAFTVARAIRTQEAALKARSAVHDVRAVIDAGTKIPAAA